jgi:hypothetical protein
MRTLTQTGADTTVTTADQPRPEVEAIALRRGVFGLHVDTRKQTPVRLGEECKSDAPDE